MTVAVGTSDNKCKRNTMINPLTAGDLSELQTSIDASDNTMAKIIQTVKGRIGAKVWDQTLGQWRVTLTNTVKRRYNGPKSIRNPPMMNTKLWSLLVIFSSSYIGNNKNPPITDN